MEISQQPTPSKISRRQWMSWLPLPAIVAALGLFSARPIFPHSCERVVNSYNERNTIHISCMILTIMQKINNVFSS